MSRHEKPYRAPVRSVSTLLFGLASIFVIGALPAACQSGGVGDPCTPDLEADSTFTGFDLAEEYIESRSFHCDTRICIVNHFQGRVSCPLGQPPPRSCGASGDPPCADGESCVASTSVAPECDPADPSACATSGGICHPEKRTCTCATSEDCPSGSACDPVEKECRRYVCQVPGACQRADATDEENKGKACCAPGTDTPVNTSVCGQCDAGSGRAAEEAVYCSCRCGPPEGEAPDENFDYCSCPSGFECAEVRRDFDLGDPQLRGKYCIKQGTAFAGEGKCGAVKGYFEPGQCVGLASASSP